MTLAEFKAMDLAAAWAGFTAEQQAAIGVAALRQHIAANVAGESPKATTPQDRWAAEAIDMDATLELVQAIEAAMPGTVWFTPMDT